MPSSISKLDQHVVLVLGGARSGKSSFAEELLEENEGDLCYLATGREWDDEMKKRVAVHKSRRAKRWMTVEEPIDLSTALSACNGRPVLVDCLTLWVTNLMMQPEVSDEAYSTAFDELMKSLAAYNGQVVIVSNEVGLGVVPDNAMARQFRDLSGILHQKIATLADDVYFVVAGLPQKLK